MYLMNGELMKIPMNAVVTGASGFLGSAVILNILESGGSVTALVRKNSPHRSRLKKHERLIVVEGDLDNIASSKQALAQLSPDVFYHLAWDGVGNIYRNDPIQLSNIHKTLETIRLSSEIGCRRWIGAGSQAEYGPLNRCITENDRLEPTTLYGAAKASACLLAQVAGKQNGIETAWARVFSTYGPGDNSGWMLVDVIRQLLNGQRPALTLGEQLWDYLYVDDAVNAFVTMGTVARLTGIYNLGSGKSSSIREIVEKVRDMIDPALPLGFGKIPYRHDQVMHLEADISKLTEATGWHPHVTLEAGLKKLLLSITADCSAAVTLPSATTGSGEKG